MHSRFSYILRCQNDHTAMLNKIPTAPSSLTNMDKTLIHLTLLLDQVIRQRYAAKNNDEMEDDGMCTAVDELDCRLDDGTSTLVNRDDCLGANVAQEAAKSRQAQQNILWTLILLALNEEENMKIAQLSASTFVAKMAATRMRIKQRTTRKTAELKFFMDPISGNLRPMTPMLSSWWIWYIQDPKPESIQRAKKFRSRFRLPYASFLHLLKMLGDDGGDSFKRWSTTSNNAI